MDVWCPLVLLLLVLEMTSMCAAARANSRKKMSKTDIANKVMEKYQKSDPPPNQPTEVKLGIYVNSFYSISEQTMDYSVSFYLRLKWLDSRLSFASLDSEYDTIKLAPGKWKELWVPDVFFRNEKRAMFHDITQENRMLKLNSTGYLWYVSKISAALSCPMNLQKYPMDTQTCPMMFESFGYTMDVMYFAWLPAPVDVDKGMEMPQFALKDHILYDCSQNYTGGAFPCLEMRFVLSRDIGYFIIQVYVPTILIVILSWVSFWLNIDAIPARVSLGLLTVLTMTTASSGANASLPKVSYIKAIDVWISMCLVFVFIALLEFAVVNVISRKGVRTINPLRRPPVQKLDAEQRHLDQPDQRGLPKCCQAAVNRVDNGRDRRNAPKVADPESKIKAQKIDKMSRKIFPMAFVLFNLVYWIMYAVPTSSKEEE